MTTTVETSVFIQAGSAEPRVSVSGRPLLRSSTSSTTKSTSSMICNDRYRQIIIGIIIFAVLILAAVIIFVVFTIAKPKDRCQVHEGKNFTDIQTLSTSQKDQCLTKLSIVEDCPMKNSKSWIFFYEKSKLIQSLEDLIWLNQSEPFESAMVSPRHRISTNTCEIEISLNFPIKVNFQVFALLDGQHFVVNMTSDSCHLGVINSCFLTSQSESYFYIVVVFASSLESVEDIYGSITSSPCTVQFKEFMIPSSKLSIKQHPVFATVEEGTLDICTTDIYNQQSIVCNWMGVTQIGNSNFDRYDSHSCIEQGVQIDSERVYIWFFGLPVTSNPVTDGYLISPIIKRGQSSHVSVFFWYFSKCNDTTIRVYIVPSYCNLLTGLPADLQPAKELNLTSDQFINKTTSIVWQFAYYDIEVPQSLSTFQILIQGICTNTICTSYDTNLCRKFHCDGEYSSILGLDDIGVEMRFDECSVRNKSESDINLDCFFQDPNNQSTTCSWKSSEENHSINLTSFIHWRPIDSPQKSSNTSDHGVNPDHLHGRGSVLNFDATGRVDTENNFSSPVIIGNSNCSCIMSFLYLLRGELAPTLQVNIALKSNATTLKRSIIPQWALYGPQNDTWVRASFPINIRTVPFQIYFRVADLEDAAGDVAVDDITFINCDIRLYKT